MTSTTLADHPLLSRRYRSWLVTALLVVSIFHFADRVILSVLAQPIKEELKLTDTDLGLLQGLGFAILYSALGVPIGWMAERVSRKALLAGCLAVWSLMTAAGGFATNFVTLLASRIGVGVGEAGFLPLSNSLLSDHFRSDRRASMLSIVMLGGPLGLLLGQAVGGWIAAGWGWRMALFAVGLPGLLSALLVLFTLREPPRGLAEGHVTTEAAPSVGAVIRHLWSKPAFRHLLAATTLAQFGMNGVANFVLPLYLRGFGLPLATAGALFGAVSLASNFPGMLLGGFGFDALARQRDPRWSMWGPAIVNVACAPLYIVAFSSANIWISLAFLWSANIVLVTHITPSSATTQNLVGPRMRATASALVALVIGLIGAGLGPTFVGMASDFFAGQAFGGDFIASCPGGRAAPGAAAGLDEACRGASAQGLRYALMSIQVFFVWAGVHYFLAARTLKENVYRPPAAQPAVAA